VEPPWALVASGELPPQLTAFDKAVRPYMDKYKITAGVLAVMKDGRLVFNRGYGWLNPARTEAVQPDTPMRFASVVKPITRAAIHKLIADGKTLDGQALTLQTKAFAALGVTPLNLPGHQMDSRLKEITIQHLLDHKGGWDSKQLPLGDPMFQTPLVSQATGHQPAGANDVIRFMAGQPLQRDPGTKDIYSNFGYCVLGRIIEKASGKKYIDYLREDLLGPLGIGSFEVGRSLPTDRNPREPMYVSREPPVPNVMRPALPPCPACDGGFHLEAMDSHGGLIGTAADLLRFAAKFDFDGMPYTSGPKMLAHYGSLPGTTSLLRWRDKGVLFAAIFNLRHPGDGFEIGEFLKMDGAEIDGSLQKAADSISEWP
jgi:N-acyl-D-amino-acid deacylase